MDMEIVDQKLNKKGKLQKRPLIMYIMTIVFFVYSIFLLFPIAFAFNSALKNGDQDFIINLTKITTNPRFANFFEAFFELEISGITFFDMSLNSLWFSVGTTVLNVFSSMCLAYGVSKYKFKGKDFIYNFVLIIMIFPVFGTLPARFKLYSNLGFIDSPLILLAYTGAFDGQFLVLYAFFKNVDGKIVNIFNIFFFGICGVFNYVPVNCFKLFHVGKGRRGRKKAVTYLFSCLNTLL